MEHTEITEQTRMEVHVQGLEWREYHARTTGTKATLMDGKWMVELWRIPRQEEQPKRAYNEYPAVWVDLRRVSRVDDWTPIWKFYRIWAENERSGNIGIIYVEQKDFGLSYCPHHGIKSDGEKDFHDWRMFTFNGTPIFLHSREEIEPFHQHLLNTIAAIRQMRFEQRQETQE